MSGDTLEPVLDLNAAAEALGCSRRWLQGWLRENREYGYRIGNRPRFTLTDIVNIREALKVRQNSSETARTRMTASGTSGVLSADAALKKALALASASEPKSSSRRRRSSSTT